MNSKESVEELQSNQVWKELQASLLQRKEALQARLLICPLEQVEQLRLEIRLILTYLGAPEEVLARLAEADKYDKSAKF